MYKAIIADDESTIVTGLERLLPWTEHGCEVVGTANDGNTALALVRKLKPDILFTDIRMPELDGLSLIAALRVEFPNLQITILSGYPEFEYARRAIALGVCSYVLKPSKLAELESALSKMVTKLDIINEPNPADDIEEVTNEADNAGNFIITNALRYMNENYTQRLTLPEVAEKVFISQWHLSKLIAKNTSQSFSELLNGIRIKAAKELLQDPSLKIWEISERVGFADVTHFSRIFKKLENCSALDYRNHLTGKSKTVHN